MSMSTPPTPPDPNPVYAAMAAAQRIAFAPMVFQASRVLRTSGILERIRRAGATGVTLSELAAEVPMPRYGIKVLVEAGLGIGLLALRDGRFTITPVGVVILRDPMTRVNMDFVHDVCYRGLFDLDRAVQEGRPAGLESLGPWPTIYEGLSSLPPKVQQSWFAFDHYYSDRAFPAALPLVFARHPARLLDVGGNTGRWALHCAAHDPAVRITIADLPQQLEFARRTAQERGLESRIGFHAVDLLDPDQPLPGGHDAIWMSQFLDCFGPGEIVSILERVAAAMGAESRLFILDLFWDRQPNEAAAFSLQQTSLYFTCLANGTSQMYHSEDLLGCVARSGLEVVAQHDRVGLYHTLLECRKP